MKPVSASNINVGAEVEDDADSTMPVPDSITVLHDHEYATSNPQHNKGNVVV